MSRNIMKNIGQTVSPKNQIASTLCVKMYIYANLCKNSVCLNQKEVYTFFANHFSPKWGYVSICNMNFAVAVWHGSTGIIIMIFIL